MNYLLYRLKYGPIFNFKHHLFDIKMHTLKQYNDFLKSRKYKVLSYLGFFRPNDYNSPIGIELWLSSPKDFDETELNRMLDSHNLRLLKTRCKLHLFQQAKCFSNKTGRLIGILVTHEDYYYILMDDEGNKWCETCVGKLEFIKE